MLGLAELREHSYPAHHRVAISAHGEMDWRQLAADVTATRACLNDSGDRPWALYEPDSYRFTVGLLALLAEERTVLLPGENHPGMVAALETENALFMGQFPGQNCSPTVAQGAGDTVNPLSLGGEIVVYTSGSTGKPQAIAKSLGQIDAELQTLEATWGPRLGDCLVLGTVSHQHLYGLLFQVLWPLCSGRRFFHRPFIDPAHLAQRCLDSGPVAWVMSPAHLHRLSDDLPWSGVRDQVTAVFSSGGPLDRAAADQLNRLLGQYPWEVLGSSETGGIAIRRQHAEDEPWQPLEGVEVSVAADSALRVRSPFLPDRAWYQTADIASLQPDGTFRLGPRLDRIVKIEGKRISLPEVELLLQGRAEFDQAHALVLTRKRRSVAAVAVLSPAGARALVAVGQREFLRTQRAALLRQLPAVAVPRSWRLVAELPRNSQGKLVRSRLDALFQGNRLPPVLGLEQRESGCEIRLYVDAGNPYFAGHFPVAPVLPGVVQIMWAEILGRTYLGIEGSYQGMQAIKFKHVVRPGTELRLRLDYDRERGRLDFLFESASGPHSQGCLRYQGAS